MNFVDLLAENFPGVHSEIHQRFKHQIFHRSNQKIFRIHSEGSVIGGFVILDRTFSYEGNLFNGKGLGSLVRDKSFSKTMILPIVSSYYNNILLKNEADFLYGYQRRIMNGVWSREGFNEYERNPEIRQFENTGKPTGKEFQWSEMEALHCGYLMELYLSSINPHSITHLRTISDWEYIFSGQRIFDYKILILSTSKLDVVGYLILQSNRIIELTLNSDIFENYDIAQIIGSLGYPALQINEDALINKEHWKEIEKVFSISSIEVNKYSFLVKSLAINDRNLSNYESNQTAINSPFTTRIFASKRPELLKGGQEVSDRIARNLIHPTISRV